MIFVINMNKGPDEKTLSIMKTLSDKYGAKKERGADVKFMWLDINADLGYFQSFEGAKVGQIVFLKYAKRSRFVLHEGQFTVNAISDTADKISSGEAKFINIKGGLPDLSILKK